MALNEVRVESISSSINLPAIGCTASTDYTIKVNVSGFDPYFSDIVKKAIEDLNKCQVYYAQYIDKINESYYVGGRHLGKSYSWRNEYEKERDKFDIKDVIFNDPATIVLWADGTKTVVKAENEPFDPEKGLAMAISKRALGGKYNYYDTFKKYVGRYEKKQRKG